MLSVGQAPPTCTMRLGRFGDNAVVITASQCQRGWMSLCSFHPSQTPTAGQARSAMLRMRASRSLALTSVFARGMAISVGDAFPKGVSVQVPPRPPPPAPSPLPPSPAQLNPPSLPPSPPARRLRLHHRLQTCRRLPRHHQVNFKENLPIESLTSKGNVLMVSLPGAFTPT